MPSPSVFVDSSAWLALLRARDSRHAEAEALFRRAIRDRVELITTNLVVAEVQRLLLHRVGIAAARAWLLHCDASPTLEIRFAEAALHTGALEWLDRLDDHAISYTDAISFALMEAAKIPAALTFDRDFATAGFPPWQG